MADMPEPVLIGRAVRRDTPDGYRYVNGRPHGFNWVPRWEVAVQFASEADAERFRALLMAGGLDDAHHKP